MVQILIDVHCHINLYLTIDKVIKNAHDAGVEKIIAVAMSSISQERILEIASQYNEVYASLGIHPEEVKMNEKIEQQLDSIIDLIIKNKQNICAIGEIGLDHYFVKDKELYSLQKTIFERMLLLAQDMELPVNLHTKGAEKIVFDILPSYRIPNINIHWYSGPEKYLKLGMDRGYYFSITPAVSYSPAVKKVVLNVDNEHILLESDGPVKYSGKVGVPAMIKEVLNSISMLKEINSDELEQQIEANTRKIFPKIF
ncbi:MAG: TatD family hydrolase [Candidatus Lokiarchaeota archaeon]|nr:TatD family hydrolase [Candidatus Lokiarchaeota archaeon]